MKFIVGGFIFVLLFSSVVYLQISIEEYDEAQVKAYMDSKGKAKVPDAWRGKIGKGI